MTSTRTDQTGAGCAWAIGLGLGAMAVVGLLELGYAGLGVAAVALGLIAWKGPRQIAFGGFLVGLGAPLAYLWAVVSLWTWTLGAIATMIVGVALTVAAIRRGRWGVGRG